MKPLKKNHTTLPLPAHPASIPSQTRQNQRPSIKPILKKTVILRHSNTSALMEKKPRFLSCVELCSIKFPPINFCLVRKLCRLIKDAKMISSFRIRKEGLKIQKSKHLKHIMSSLHHIKKLAISCTDGEDNLEKTLTRLRRFKDISSFDVHFFCAEEKRNRLLRCLFQQMKMLRRLKKLKLYPKKYPKIIPGVYRPNGGETNALILSKKYPTSLEFLTIHFRKSSLPNHKLFNSFVSRLSSCKLLTSVYLDCRKISSFNEFSELNLYVPLFEKASNIKTLKIKKTFLYTFQLEELKSFLAAFQSLKHLHALTFQAFFSAQKDIFQFFADHFCAHLALLENLKYLSLQIDFWRSNPHSKDFFLGLRSLQSLKQLSLDLYAYGETDLSADLSLPFGGKCIRDLFETIGSLQKLEEFKFCLLDHRISFEDLNCLSRSFKKLNHLRSLSLISNKVTYKDGSLDSLYQSINHLTKLNSLTFNLEFKKPWLCPDPSASIARRVKVESFVKILNNLKLVSTLNLNLASFEISLAEIRNLSFALRKLENLSEISLEFPQFDLVDYLQCFESLLHSLEERRKLTSLQLFFEGGQIWKKEVEFIVSSLGESNSSERPQLDFYKPGKLNRSLIVVQNTLRTLLSLKNLTLDFGKTWDEKKNILDKGTIVGLFEVLSFLKNLERVSIQVPSKVVLSDFDGLSEKFSRHWNLNLFTVNGESCL